MFFVEIRDRDSEFQPDEFRSAVQGNTDGIFEIAVRFGFMQLLVDLLGRMGKAADPVEGEGLHALTGLVPAEHIPAVAILLQEPGVVLLITEPQDLRQPSSKTCNLIEPTPYRRVILIRGI